MSNLFRSWSHGRRVDIVLSLGAEDMKWMSTKTETGLTCKHCQITQIFTETLIGFIVLLWSSSSLQECALQQRIAWFASVRARPCRPALSSVIKWNSTLFTAFSPNHTRTLPQRSQLETFWAGTFHTLSVFMTSNLPPKKHQIWVFDYITLWSSRFYA